MRCFHKPCKIYDTILSLVEGVAYLFICFEEKNAFVVIWAKKKKRKKRYPCGQILQRKEFSWFQLMISLLDRNSSVEQINNRAHILEKEICG